MSDQDPPVFLPPSDPNITIWRYMDFTKFVSMLENSGLFFSRLDRLGDPFEGSFPEANDLLRPSRYPDLSQDALQNWKENVVKYILRFSKMNREWVMVNCWHMNECESAAMWKLYSKSSECVAIKSNYSRLSETLHTSAYIGVVKYIDYEKDWMPEDNALYPVMHKRKSFEHERELRAVVWPLSDAASSKDGQPIIVPPPPEYGVWKPVELDRLIEGIYVAPNSPLWFKELVIRIVVRYGLNKPVVQSSLDREPLF